MFENQSWYQSTAGPAISQNIANIALSFLPVVGLVFKLDIGPDVVNAVVYSAVFLFFATRAVLGYVRAKRVLGAEILRLKGENDRLTGPNLAQLGRDC